MGIICSITAKNPTSFFRTQALKREKVMKVSKICKDETIQIKEHISSETTDLSKLKFQELTSLKSKTTVVQNSKLTTCGTVLSSSGNTNNLIGQVI